MNVNDALYGGKLNWFSMEMGVGITRMDQKALFSKKEDHEQRPSGVFCLPKRCPLFPRVLLVVAIASWAAFSPRFAQGTREIDACLDLEGSAFSPAQPGGSKQKTNDKSQRLSRRHRQKGMDEHSPSFVFAIRVQSVFFLRIITTSFLPGRWILPISGLLERLTSKSAD
uniref:Transmembrane protein n=1 Tax=Panagrellus redivivus TaxID=6233 RepID=A0A7E4UWZ5_PANRE